MSAAPALTPRSLLAYGVASLPSGFSFILISTYLLKFSTDVLGVGPAVMGWLLFASRLWDAGMDPLIGTLSDRTRSRFGRRRPWLLLGAAPMAAGFGMLFGAPAQLGANGSAYGLELWMGAGLLLYCSGVTLIEVPYAALGAELSPVYRERNRVFGFKRAFFGVGALAGIGALVWLERSAAPRAAGRQVAWLGAAAVLALVAITGFLVRERAGQRGRAQSGMLGAFADVLRNPHARLLLAVFGLQQIGVAALSAALPFLSEYVLHTAEWTGLYLFALILASLAGVPIWLRIALRREKRTCLRISMVVVLLAIAALCAAGRGNVALVVGLAALGGLASAGMDVLGPSLQADVIDWDELHTGQRKEGAYFALWAFAQKSATALALLVVGQGLDWIGFAPNAEQSERAELGLRVLTGGVPAFFFGLGLLAFWRFRLTAEEHAGIRRAIDARV